MRIIARFEKAKKLSYISHLDVQRLFQRAFRRANVPVAFSQGFNPHPLLSFATALSIGISSEAEWLDATLSSKVSPESFKTDMNKVLPDGIKIIEAVLPEDNTPSLTVLMDAATYFIMAYPGRPESLSKLGSTIKTMLEAPILVEKTSKGKTKQVDLLPLIKSMEVQPTGDNFSLVRLVCTLTAQESLNVDLLLKHLKSIWDNDAEFNVHRYRIFSKDGTIFPKLS